MAGSRIGAGEERVFARQGERTHRALETEVPTVSGGVHSDSQSPYVSSTALPEGGVRVAPVLEPDSEGALRLGGSDAYTDLQSDKPSGLTEGSPAQAPAQSAPKTVVTVSKTNAAPSTSQQASSAWANSAAKTQGDLRP